MYLYLCVHSYYSDPTCQVVDAYKLKIFNQAYCFDTIYGSPYPGGAKYNCDGTVSSYTNNTCKKLNPPPSTKVRIHTLTYQIYNLTHILSYSYDNTNIS